MWRERPAKGEGKGVVLLVTPYPSRWRTSAEKRVALSTVTPIVRARRTSLGHAWGLPATSVVANSGESVSARVQCGLPGKASTTTARALPSEKKASWVSKACHPSMTPPLLKG